MSQIISKQYFDLLCRSNLNVGFFGGSFNPFHYGHSDLAHRIVKILQLDALIILVAHYSSIKKYHLSATQRAQTIAEQITHPKIFVSNIEEELGYKFTCLIAKYIAHKSPHKRYMIFGADALVTLHQWEYFEILAMNLNLVCVNRGDYTIKAMNAKTMPLIDQFVRLPYNNISSTALRARAE